MNKDSDQGASAVEFALVLPILVLLVFGIIEFGLMFQGQLAVTHAAREGARLAAVNNWDPAVVEARAFPLTVAEGLSISLTTPSEDSVRVVVSYPWDWFIFPFGDSPTLSSTATMRAE